MCCLWDGYDTGHLPTVRLRPSDPYCYGYVVYRARFTDLAAYLRMQADPCYVPVVVWPCRRHWCIYLSFASWATYVGGPADIVDQLLTAVPGATVVRPEDPET